MDDDLELKAAFADLERLHGSDSEATRRSRIQALSDNTLSRYYSLLSDGRYVTRVSALPLLEEEMRRRGLPLGRSH